MKTFSAKPADIQQQWYVIDANQIVLGRLAVQVATLLRGKHKPYYTPHMNCGDHVIIINADKIQIKGKKLTDKIYYRHTGFPGGIKETTPAKIFAGAHPQRVVEMAVKRMLPKNTLGRQQYKMLRVYAGSEHPHEAQQPMAFDFASKNEKNAR
ncbi:MAG: 50S ribosomal protein L13 [Alphaproteobacteria bacterium]|nr:MAG: 50S ribosomal protein L13 [Alphaproteobacteria bacterium]TAF14986.1 MAG: 50S ribosomal protein L13 [Alphaproteobacteria bacterium]TAF40791.1 MAG: 50S ribosomal protein L13 [Alphaproteobacteria bacterium]TAF76638.1 MAG: 50S ribosomal protein L13 [Alphaproteobacteria bacterium]